MKIDNVYQIAKREWDNISILLSWCGELQNLDFGRFISTNPGLILSLCDMEEKLVEYGYTTTKAGYVFTELAGCAAMQLGLDGDNAEIFGSAYSWVRTGWYFPLIFKNTDKKSALKSLRMQIIFYKLFFPFKEDYDWDFDCPHIHAKLLNIYDIFLSWQNEPGLYSKEYPIYKPRISNILEGLNLTLQEPAGSC